MIKNLISNPLPLEDIMKRIKTLNMATEINELVTTLCNNETLATAQSRRATIMRMVNPHTNTLTLHCTGIGNITLTTITHNRPSPHLFSVPGKSILFALDQPFEVQRYARHDNELEKTDLVTVSPNKPLVIEGSRTVFDYGQVHRASTGLAGRINLLNKSSDIGVFDRTSLKKVAWLPHDESAARYLVSLELLETIRDPKVATVAEELIYHYHPAVAWKAFQLLYQAAPQHASGYIPLLKKHQSSRLDQLLGPLEMAA
ncbi:hypothetical protein [Pseudomonas sp. AF32]|uniref:hypothetical protein n=1 Tax=Pseudomonas sp. AF32 TaxID=554390 RepID=UPI001EEF5788|nr:hypothetical protein [Pseudomonas sp. AF32]